MISYEKLQIPVSMADAIAINELLAYLQSHPINQTVGRIEDIARENIIFVARKLETPDSKRRIIVGMATLVRYNLFSGNKGLVEDVVVHPDCSGRGIGKGLMEALIIKARCCGLSMLDLTSKPEREAANQFYQSLGFQLRETNVYRLKL